MDTITKTQSSKEKTDTLDFIKVKLSAPKDTFSGVKRQPTGWEKIFANHLSDKGSIPRIYRKRNNKNQTT